ncbi:sarcosine oxidase subunit gamma [Sphingomonas sp. MMS24-J13]|uniref:sarcosine oxidase subunit gamma n=1 Tax=Sphingomonas sp. MMS24-J13 TaxID=3238686 RepID=UPI00385028E2
MTEPTISILPPTPLHVLEIWSNARDVAARFDIVLPPMGRSTSHEGLILIRFEPTVWLVEGDPAPLASLIGDDGALTAIGGGIARVRIAGPGWRTLLMEGGLFDAESPTFAPGCAAATIIDHVAVRLWVESEDACLAYVPASYAAGLVHFWGQALPSLAV